MAAIASNTAPLDLRAAIALSGLILAASGACSPADGDPGADAGPGADSNVSRDASTPADADPGSDAAPPTLGVEFTSEEAVLFYELPRDGAITFGASDGPSAPSVLELLFPGVPGMGPDYRVSPAFATEVGTLQSVHFGTYRARVALASCAQGEEVVNGIFLYQNGGDANANGITDNTEIDYEILCGEPHYLWLTVWTDYDEVAFRKTSRVIDTRTGEYYQTPPGEEDTYNLGSSPLGTIPEAAMPGFPAPGAFYEMGFDWDPDRVRYFMVIEGQEVTLWDFDDPSLVPQNSAWFLFNLWHTGSHWMTGGEADYPAADAVMKVDWLRYWAR
ncbi:MAG: glycoside hydrolase family 16 protein [Polyangia bacterium]|jgi:hypothetical protein|nr:glycoside hydrolase family 16 protein [Polyangia bacterium]